MGWLDAFLGKGGAKRTIAFPELEGWVEEETEKSKNEIVGESKPITAHILDARDKLRESVLKLEALPLQNPPPRLGNILKASKPEYTNSMLAVLNGIRIGKDAGYEQVMDFHKNLAESLEKAAKITLSQGRYLPFAYGDAFTTIQKEIKNLIDAVKRMEAVSAKAGRIRLLEATRDSKKEFEKAREDKTLMEDRINALNKEIKELEDGLSKAGDEHALLLQDPQILKLTKKAGENTKRRELIKTQVHENMTSISRALRKYRRIAVQEKRLPMEAVENLDGLIENPVEQFLSGKDASAILQDLEKATAEGKVEVKNPGKLRRTLGECIERLTPALAGEYNSLLEEQDRLQDELNNTTSAQKTRLLEASISRIKTEITAKKDELKAVERKHEELGEHTAEARRKIEDKLEELGMTLLEEPSPDNRS